MGPHPKDDDAGERQDSEPDQPFFETRELSQNHLMQYKIIYQDTTNYCAGGKPAF